MSPTRSVYCTVTVQVFFDDDEVQGLIEQVKNDDEGTLTTDEAISQIATESVSDVMPLSEDVMKVRGISVDLSTLK